MREGLNLFRWIIISSIMKIKLIATNFLDMKSGKIFKSFKVLILCNVPFAIDFCIVRLKTDIQYLNKWTSLQSLLIAEDLIIFLIYFKDSSWQLSVTSKHIGVNPRLASVVIFEYLFCFVWKLSIFSLFLILAFATLKFCFVSHNPACWSLVDVNLKKRVVFLRLQLPRIFVAHCQNLARRTYINVVSFFGKFFLSRVPLVILV